MNNKDGYLVEIKRTRFANEKEIQQTVENNLEKMLNLTLVDSEFSFGRHRIDTLAFDDARKIFVIIEYKIDEDKRISNQVYGYYGDMIANKSDFLLAYRDNIGTLNKQDVNWEKTRILLIAPKFDESLLSALRAPDVKFELWKIHSYQHGIIEFKQLRNINNRIEEMDSSVPALILSKKRDTDFILNKYNENTQQIYEELERQIMEIDNNIEISIKKLYTSFKINGQAFVRVYIRKNELLIYIRIKSKEMRIPKRSTLIIKKAMRSYVGSDFEIAIYKKSDIIHLMKLIKQSYERSTTVGPIASQLSTKSREYDILSECNASTRSLYDEIKDQILKLGNNIVVYGTKYRIIFKTKRNFVLFRMSRNKMRVYLPISRNEFQRLQDGNLDAVHDSREVRIMISNRSEIPPLMRLVEYSYNRHAGSSIGFPKKIAVQTTLGSDRYQSSKYTEDDYLNGKYIKFNLSPEIKKLWSETRRQILNLGDLEVKQVKTYAKFCPKGENRPICGLGATNSKLNLTYNTKVRDGLLSPSDFVMDISKKGHLGLGHYKSYITTKSDIAKAIPLIKKIYQDRLKF